MDRCEGWLVGLLDAEALGKWGLSKFRSQPPPQI
jgi:hypothetical protein